MYYPSLRYRPTQSMKVEDVVSKLNHRGFPIPHVTGLASLGEVNIPVSTKAARQVQIGETLEFIETNDKTREYMMRTTLDDQLSQIWFTIAGYPVNFIALFGVCDIRGSTCVGSFRKTKIDS